MAVVWCSPFGNFCPQPADPWKVVECCRLLYSTYIHPYIHTYIHRHKQTHYLYDTVLTHIFITSYVNILHTDSFASSNAPTITSTDPFSLHAQGGYALTTSCRPRSWPDSICRGCDAMDKVLPNLISPFFPHSLVSHPSSPCNTHTLAPSLPSPR